MEEHINFRETASPVNVTAAWHMSAVSGAATKHYFLFHQAFAASRRWWTFRAGKNGDAALSPPMRCSLGCMAYIAGSSEDRQQTGHLSYSSLPLPPSSFYKVLGRHRVTASLIGKRSSGRASFHWRTQSRRPLWPLRTSTNLNAPPPQHP